MNWQSFLWSDENKHELYQYRLQYISTEVKELYSTEGVNVVSLHDYDIGPDLCPSDYKGTDTWFI